VEKAAFTRADLVEIVGAQLPVDTERTPRELVEAAVDAVGVRLTAPRAAHQREGHERFTLDRILAEEMAVLDLVDARNDRALLWVKDDDTAALSPDQKRAVGNIGRSPWLVHPLCAPAGAGKTTSMRALRAAAHRRRNGTVVVVAPTGKAVDVAVREGAADVGLTIAKALQLLADKKLELGPHTLVVVDEAAMVGTQDLRKLLTATTDAGAKTVIVGDQYQLAPVKARGGMFAQLCTDLPWTQHLSEVWRMRDPDERTASLALRNGGPASARRAIGWYRTNHRLHCGDAVTMAADAIAGYKADTAAGKDALLLCDTIEMADALNQRLHHDTIAAGAPTVTGARGHRLVVGDLILSRQNDISIPLRNTNDPAAEQNPVRNGNRWRVTQINPDKNRLIARRLDDNTLGAFSWDYVREHITYGYAVTVHSAQGVTAETTHAVLGETATRSLVYVAISRGRDANTAYLYQRTAEHEYPHGATEAAHVMQRGSGQHAARLLRAIVANDDQPMTAHDIATATAHDSLPSRVHGAIDHRATAIRNRTDDYQRWHVAVVASDHAMRGARGRDISRDRSIEDGLEL
jgi:AAA domain-containing protein